MSKDDMETNTMNVMFDGSDETDDKDDDIELERKRIEKFERYFEDDYYMYYKNRRHLEGR